MKSLLLILILLAGFVSCSRKATDNQGWEPKIEYRTVGGEASYLPKATVFKMSGNFGDKVAVTLNPDGTLAYYPAPSDITLTSNPVDLGGGWWLNRQGISSGSVFTNWTFDQYRNLKSTPSREEIINAIIPGARVVEMKELPVTLSDAVRDPEICKSYLN